MSTPDSAMRKPVARPSDAFLEALLDEATDGPWIADRCWLRGARDVFMGGFGFGYSNRDEMVANANLCALARGVSTVTDTAVVKAPRNEDGTFFYVVTQLTWGRSYSHLKRAATLAEAKRQFGWTRQLHTSIRVRRAATQDVAELQEER